MCHKADELTLWEQGVIQSPQHEHLGLFDMAHDPAWIHLPLQMEGSAMCHIFQTHVAALDPPAWH